MKSKAGLPLSYRCTSKLSVGVVLVCQSRLVRHSMLKMRLGAVPDSGGEDTTAHAAVSRAAGAYLVSAQVVPVRQIGS